RSLLPRSPVIVPLRGPARSLLPRSPVIVPLRGPARCAPRRPSHLAAALHQQLASLRDDLRANAPRFDELLQILLAPERHELRDLGERRLRVPAQRDADSVVLRPILLPGDVRDYVADERLVTGVAPDLDVGQPRTLDRGGGDDLDRAADRDVAVERVADDRDA